MATITHFPTVTKTPKEQASKTALPPFRSSSSTLVQGGFGKTKRSSPTAFCGKLKLSSPTADKLEKLKLSSPTAYGGNFKPSSPSIMIAAMCLLDEVEDEVHFDSEGENEIRTSDAFMGCLSDTGFRFRPKRKKYVKKLKRNPNLDKPVTFYDGYSNAMFRQFQQIDTEPEGPILLGAVLPRKPRKSLPPAKFPSPPGKSHRVLPPRGFQAYKIAMRWPITLAILAGRNFPNGLPAYSIPLWFCVHFFRSMNQKMPRTKSIPKQKIKEFLMNLGIYSSMCEKWPAIGQEETEFWSNIYKKHGAKSELKPAEYYNAGLTAAAALDLGGFLSRLVPGSYTKREVENTFCDFKVDITVREFAGVYLLKELQIPLDRDYKPCPGTGCFSEPIPADSLILLPGFVAF